MQETVQVQPDKAVSNQAANRASQDSQDKKAKPAKEKQAALLIRANQRKTRKPKKVRKVNKDAQEAAATVLLPVVASLPVKEADNPARVANKAVLDKAEANQVNPDPEVRRREEAKMITSRLK
jgi:hypothetical protein